MASERTRKRTLVTQELIDSGKDYGWSNGVLAYKYPDGPVLTKRSIGTYQMLLDPPVDIDPRMRGLDLGFKTVAG